MHLRKYNDKSHSRLKAYADYLKKGKIKGSFLEYKDFYRNKEELWNLVRPIIENQQENIAFACWNDVDAINLLELLNIYKVETKYKLGVMGFDDILLCAHTTPPLTTVHYPFDEAAKNAILIIEKGVGNKESPPSHSVNGYIVERESL